MGSGTSSLTHEQSAELAARMKKCYQVCVEEKFENEIMQSTMTLEYNKILKEFADKAADPATNETKEKPVKSHSAETLVHKKESVKLGNHLRSDSSSRLKPEGGSTKRAPTRRRSFDQAVKKVKEQTDIIATMAAMVEVNQSEKAAAAPAAEPVADSWDSVTTQPFCTVCQMAFKSQAFLDRHVKYSDLHTKNVKKAQGIVDPIPEEKVVEVPATSPVKQAELPDHQFLAKQVEGVHFKLLYSGSKFFWRNQRTVILDMYVHLLSQTIEVISFDSDKHKEMNRIYLDEDAINDIVEANIMEEFLERKKALLVKDRFATEADVAAIKETMMTNTRLSYILSRLQLGINQSKNSIIEFIKLSGDNFTVRNPLLEEPPIVLVPVNITRRRRTNAEEIEKEMSSISSDFAQMNADIDKARSLSKDSGAMLLKASGHAEKIANAVYNASQYFMKRKWWNQIENPLRRKWVKAIRKVIFIRLVNKNKENLKQREIPFIGKVYKWEEGVFAPTSPKKPARNSIRLKGGVKEA